MVIITGTCAKLSDIFLAFTVDQILKLCLFCPFYLVFLTSFNCLHGWYFQGFIMINGSMLAEDRKWNNLHPVFLRAYGNSFLEAAVLLWLKTSYQLRMWSVFMWTEDTCSHASVCAAAALMLLQQDWCSSGTNTHSACRQSCSDHKHQPGLWTFLWATRLWHLREIVWIIWSGVVWGVINS